MAEMTKFLQSNNISSGFEIMVDPQNFHDKEIRKRRSVVVVGLSLDREDDLRDFLMRKGLSLDQTFVDPFLSLEALRGSNRIDKMESRLETNWRGRVLRFGPGADMNFDSDDETFERMFLKSYFRLIISRVRGEYFGKHDISPIFYSPGSSTAGFEDFRYAVESVVKFVIRGAGTEWCPSDLDFDYLKAFISRERGQAYQHVHLLNQGEIPVGELVNRVNDGGKDLVVDQMYNELLTAFGNVRPQQ
ncbi:MAG: hypothetical protein KF681_10965 [Bdellovibrionaceae bacterium]|nr:hypothetical protein [Pseudobdellovibrionaceae bacterium]